MNSLIKAVALAVIVAAPIASFAQSNQPVTRAQVRAELAQLNSAGYHAGGHDPYYPNDAQVAEARGADQSGVGGTVGGTALTGAPAAVTGAKSIYFGQ